MIKSLHPTNPNKKLKVCAYCRISSDKDEQETSLIEQITYYSDLIIDNENWEFAGIFADDGISGTSTIKREQFKTMLKKAHAGGIDIIITKSISRFARNVTDLLETIHELRIKGIEVYFEREDFSTLDYKADMMLTIYAKFAEEEAEAVSKNVIWRQEINKRNGTYYINTWQLLGYKYTSDHKIVIVESEAKWIRQIFKMYLDDIPVRLIAEYLENNNVRAPLGGKKWYPNTIRNILKNEKYVGDCLIQKTFTSDKKTHATKKNNGEVDQVYIENGHPPIIDRDTWNKALEKRTQRVKQFKIRTGELSINKSKYSGLLYCPHCKKNYFLKTLYSSKRKAFYCSSNREVLTCKKSESIFLDQFENCLIEQVNILLSNIKELKTALISAYLETNGTNEQDERINALEAQIKALQERYESYKHSNEEAIIVLKQKTKDQLQELMKEKLILQNNLFQFMNPEEIANSYISYLKEIKHVETAEDFDYKKLFAKVIIISRDEIRFIIGNADVSKVNLKKNPLFRGSIKYKERATWYTTNFGIIINQ